jgi:thioredoxin-dependent peroxiredoxin
MDKLKSGDKAPAFTLPDQHGNKIKLTDFRGARLLLYFFPKAGTSG